jgi:glycosyltransferase involved in cell wall biosynthesis
MKIAIVQDDLMRRGGAEQVVRCLHMAFPEAPIYTLCYQPQLTYPYFKECDVRTSWFQSVVSTEKAMKMLFFPIGLLAMQQLDVTGYDVVLLSSTYCAKYVKVSENTIVINYCHNPFRLLWHPESYAEYHSKGLKKLAVTTIIKAIRHYDFKTAQRTNYFITNTSDSAERIRKAYKPSKEIAIIKPPVNCSNFHVAGKTGSYYLLVARLEYYKRVDLAIEVFNDLGYPLVIVGRGPKEAELKKQAKSNITFKSGLSNVEIARLYAECKAFIFPQHEDYGITPLEANASGRPVIAYGQGGVLETMIPYTDDSLKATAVFFPEQTPESLKQAIATFEQLTFSPAFIRAHAGQFDELLFIEKIKQFVIEKYATYKSLPESRNSLLVSA